jgi:taurine dioxygenase
LDIPGQRRFVRYFGDVQDSRTPVERKNPEVMYVANVTVDGQIGEIPNGDMHFHNDHACYDRPTKGTSLYALEIPSVGGNTMFASTAGAYAAVPAELRATLEELEVLFVHDYVNHGNHRGEPVWDGAPRHAHPLVIAHPATGRPLLFCNRLMAHSIVGYERAASDALIEQLCGYLERPENVYEHVWQVNDLLLWDNLATAHARTDFDPAERRALRRIAMKGSAPVSYLLRR